jgi:hypothetical protein
MFGSQAPFLYATLKCRRFGMSVRTVSSSYSSALAVHLKNTFLSVAVAYDAGCCLKDVVLFTIHNSMHIGISVTSGPVSMYRYNIA